MWTYVSMYFNLDKYYDNYEGKGNSSKFYVEKFKLLSKLGIKLVIYTDKESKDLLLPYSNENIKFIINRFEDLELYEYLETIKNLRKDNIIYKNHRAIPELSMVQASKLEAIKKAIELNYFSSDIFVWLDFGYFRPDHDYVDYSLEQLNNQFKIIENSNIYKKDTIHIGLINWVHKDIFNNLSEFYKGDGRCTVTSGYFFGNITAFKILIEKYKNIFREHIELKYFHADEQVLFYSAINNPDLFTFFPTDYFCSPFDVIFPQKRVFITTELLIPNLIKDKQKIILKEVIERLLISHSVKKIELSMERIKAYENILINS